LSVLLAEVAALGGARPDVAHVALQELVVRREEVAVVVRLAGWAALRFMRALAGRSEVRVETLVVETAEVVGPFHMPTLRVNRCRIVRARGGESSRILRVARRLGRFRLGFTGRPAARPRAAG